ERRRFGGYPGWVEALAFSPDGRMLATGSSAGMVRLWDAVTGKELHQLAGHQGGVKALVFSAQGKTLASGGTDTTALVWDVAGLLRQGRPPAVKLSSQELEFLWADLGGEDVPRAYLALHTLTAAAEQVVPLVKERIRPV